MDTNKSGRLLLHATKVKTDPYQSPQALWNALGVGRAQYYRDKEALKKIGFIYGYSRQQRRFVIHEEPYLPVYDLSMTEMLALTMAVRQLSAAGDFVLTYDALEAIKKLIANAQGEQRELLNSCLNETVLREGFGCQRDILEELTRAVQACRQVTIAYTPSSRNSQDVHNNRKSREKGAKQKDLFTLQDAAWEARLIWDDCRSFALSLKKRMAHLHELMIVEDKNLTGNLKI